MTTSKLEQGDTAPSFTLADQDGGQVSLTDYAGRKLVVYFYPAAMTPGCTKEACDFRDNLAALEGVGYAVVGISPDPPDKLAAFRDHEGLNFPLLSDVNREVMQAYGAYGEKKSYGRTLVGVIRSTFLVDEAGRIAKAMYGVKATGHVARLLREVSG